MRGNIERRKWDELSNSEKARAEEMCWVIWITTIIVIVAALITVIGGLFIVTQGALMLERYTGSEWVPYIVYSSVAFVVASAVTWREYLKIVERLGTHEK